METVIGRRVFVGSVVAGLPLLASSTAGAARAGWQAHVHPEGGLADPLLEHIVRQLASSHNALRRQLTGEHVRAFSAQLRTLVVHGRTIDLDANVKKAVAQLVERDGRDGVLYADIDRGRMRAELARYGAMPDEQVLNRSTTLDYASRSAVLNRVIVSGVIAHIERMAAVMDRVATELDRRSGTVRVNRQADAEAYCRALWDEFQEAQFLASLNCAAAALPIVGVVFAPVCVSYQLASLVFALVYGANCWGFI